MKAAGTNRISANGQIVDFGHGVHNISVEDPNGMNLELFERFATRTKSTQSRRLNYGNDTYSSVPGGYADHRGNRRDLRAVARLSDPGPEDKRRQDRPRRAAAPDGRWQTRLLRPVGTGARAR